MLLYMLSYVALFLRSDTWLRYSSMSVTLVVHLIQKSGPSGLHSLALCDVHVVVHFSPGVDCKGL